MKIDSDSFKPGCQYFDIYPQFLVSCLLQYQLPGLVSHVCHYK